MERAAGVIVGLVASWLKARSEPALQKAAERILPPTPDQKKDVGADPVGRSEYMPRAVLVNRVAVALGRGGLTAAQRVPAQRVIHYGFGAGLGVVYSATASRWPAASSVVWKSTSHVVFGTALEAVQRASG